jgi:hypothetical protein
MDIEINKYISSIWLLFDIIGAILISIYGITQSLNKDWYSWILFNTWEKEEIKKEYRKHKKWSNTWIWLIILWFVLQFLSNYL